MDSSIRHAFATRLLALLDAPTPKPCLRCLIGLVSVSRGRVVIKENIHGRPSTGVQWGLW
ncbi:hypothetical protein LCGC14_2062920 [marine sediment metagenome]|uniref:Uncharacterized protein n=1 Tax=marine sediment metagenome TaxID=412755 RepID=A0A0F9HHK1_9ZZZZ